MPPPAFDPKPSEGQIEASPAAPPVAAQPFDPKPNEGASPPTPSDRATTRRRTRDEPDEATRRIRGYLIDASAQIAAELAEQFGECGRISRADVATSVGDWVADNPPPVFGDEAQRAFDAMTPPDWYPNVVGIGECSRQQIERVLPEIGEQVVLATEIGRGKAVPMLALPAPPAHGKGGGDGGDDDDQHGLEPDELRPLPMEQLPTPAPTRPRRDDSAEPEA